MKKIVNIMLCVLMLTFGVFNVHTTVEASARIDLININHTLATSGNVSLVNANQYTTIRSNIDFYLPAGVIAGDYAEIKLPDELYFSDSFEKTLTHTYQGTVYSFAKMVIDSNTNTVRVEFLPDVTQFSNVKFDMFFENQINLDVVTTDGPKTLTFEYNTRPIDAPQFNFSFDGDSANEIANKYNWYVPGSKRIIENEIRINPTGEVYDRPIVVDTLSTPFDAMTYDRSSLKIYKGDWVQDARNVWQMASPVMMYPTNNSQFQDPIVEFDEITNSFTIDFGDHTAIGPDNQHIGEYKINYNTVSNYDILPGEIVSNKVEVFDDQNTKFVNTVPRRMASAGGSTEGYQYSVTVNKLDEFSNPLNGAEFELERVRTGEVILSGILTTSSHTFAGLLYDDYILREVTPPNGYLLNSQEYLITPANFGTSTSFSIDVINRISTDITGTKTWIDGNDQDRVRPQSLAVTLYADGQALPNVPTWTKNGNVWTYEFTGLPLNTSGKAIVYTVTEEAVNNYSSAQDGYNFTNTYNPLTTQITGTKTWIDSNDQDRVRPQTLTVTLYADGQALPNVPTWTKNGNVWTYVFTGLPVNASGKAIAYTVTEEAVNNYSSVQDGYNFTNTYNPLTTRITGTKTWIDGNDQDRVRPQTLAVTLYADGQALPNVPTWTKNGNVWTYVFTGLPVNASGKAIVYTVTEEAVNNYSSVQDGYNFTNTHELSTITIEGSKIWDDNSNSLDLRPDSITLRIYANGVELEGLIPIWDKKGDIWSYRFVDLHKYSDGLAIIYTVTEDSVENYSTSYSGLDIINLLNVTPVSEVLPSTGVSESYLGHILILCGLTMIVVRCKSKYSVK